MPVRISIETHITLADLVAKKEQGFLVEETPHIGNLSASTMALLSLGLQAKLVDITVGAKDNLFYPNAVIAGRQRTKIAPADVMTTHNKVSACGTPLSQFHLAPLNGYGFNVFAHSSWVWQRREVICKILTATIQHLPGSHMIWGRYVSEQGIVSERDPHPKLIDKVHKVTARADGEGWVIPNPLNILFDLVFGSLEHDKSKVYMLSGQSMYRYITQPFRNFGTMDGLISNLYDAVRTGGFTALPANLSVTMVPIPVVRHFAAPGSLKEALDRKLRYFETATAAIARCGRKLGSKELDKNVAKHLRHKRTALFGNLAAPLTAVCDDSENGTFYSHHDLCNNRDSMYIPDRVMDMPLNVMLDKVRRMRCMAH